MFSYTQTRDLLHQHSLSIKIFFIIFYSVGIAGLLIRLSSPWFMSLIPWHCFSVFSRWLSFMSIIPGVW
jgi:hypothetical protein